MRQTRPPLFLYPLALYLGTLPNSLLLCQKKKTKKNTKNPSKGFSLHTDKIQTLKVHPGWSGSSTLSLSAPYLLHPRLTCLQGTYSPIHTPFLKPLYGGLPAFHRSVLGPHESASEWPSLTNMAKAGPHPTTPALFPCDLTYSSSKPLLVSEINMFVHLSSTLTHQNVSSVNLRSASFITIALYSLPKPGSGTADAK